MATDAKPEIAKWRTVHANRLRIDAGAAYATIERNGGEWVANVSVAGTWEANEHTVGHNDVAAKAAAEALMREGLEILIAKATDALERIGQPSLREAHCLIINLVERKRFAKWPLRTEKLSEALASLPPRWRNIVERRACGEKLQAIGDSLGICMERVRQLEREAVIKLSKAMR